MPCSRSAPACPPLARNGPPAMSAVWSLSGGKRTWRLRAPTSEFDAVDGSSTGTSVPWMWALLRLPRFRGASHADGNDNRFRHRQVGLPSSWAHGLAGEAADQGCRNSARQQDRANGLGHDGQGRAIQGTRRACAINEIALDNRRDVKVGRANST